jgi:ribose transport system substrate-binding protein
MQLAWRMAPPTLSRVHSARVLPRVNLGRNVMIRTIVSGVLAVASLALMSSTVSAEPEIVSGPAAEAECFAPWSADTKFFKFPKKEGTYRIALANGYIANTWRIQMIQTAKAYAAQPEVAAKLKEFKVVSTGEDVPAQISAINNFIDSGYDAIVVNAQNPTAFGPVIKRAKEAGVVLVAFDNILDTEDAINVNVDQKGLGVLWANWLIKSCAQRRQDPGSARRAWHLGRHRSS